MTFLIKHVKNFRDKTKRYNTIPGDQTTTLIYLVHIKQMLLTNVFINEIIKILSLTIVTSGRYNEWINPSLLFKENVLFFF